MGYRRNARHDKAECSSSSILFLAALLTWCWMQMRKTTRKAHLLRPNYLAGSTKRSYNTTDTTRKVCTGGIPVTYDYDISLHLLWYPCITGRQDQISQNLHFQQSSDAVTMLQIEANSKEQYDFLNRSARQESFQPELEKLFRLTSTSQMVICDMQHSAIASVGHRPSARSSGRL